MHRNVLIALVLLIVIIGGSSLAHYILPKMQTRDRLMDSDAAKIIMTLKGAVDDFKGYFVFFTKEFKNYLRAQAYNADITDDKANYEERFLKVHKGELDWAPHETLESGMRKTVEWYLANPDWVHSIRSRPTFKEWYAQNYLERDEAQ